MSDSSISQNMTRNFADAKTRIVVIVGLVVVVVMVIGGILAVGKSQPNSSAQGGSARVLETSAGGIGTVQVDAATTTSERVQDLQRRAAEEAAAQAQAQNNAFIGGLDLVTVDDPLRDGDINVVQETSAEAGRFVPNNTPRVRVANLASNPIQAPRRVRRAEPTPMPTPLPAVQTDPERYNRMVDAMAQLLVPRENIPQEVKVFVAPGEYVPPGAQSAAGAQAQAQFPQLSSVETVSIDPSQFGQDAPAPAGNGGLAPVSEANGEFNDGADDRMDRKIIRAGDILYGRMITRLLSTTPSVVIGEIVEGDLKGTRLIGSFNRGYDRMSIQFTRASLPDGSSAQVQLVAIDPRTTLASMSSDVDYHTFERIALTAGTAFVAGFAEALGNVDSTTVVSSDGGSTTSQSESDLADSVFSGLSAAAAAWNAEIQKDAERYSQPSIVVMEGTVMGLVSLQDSFRETR
ncbi:MAG: hypothetical protein Alpg2KO_24360 [Alphaproteobacteria bacterium]